MEDENDIPVTQAVLPGGGTFLMWATRTTSDSPESGPRLGFYVAPAQDGVVLVGSWRPDRLNQLPWGCSVDNEKTGVQGRAVYALSLDEVLPRLLSSEDREFLLKTLADPVVLVRALAAPGQASTGN